MNKSYPNSTPLLIKNIIAYRIALKDNNNAVMPNQLGIDLAILCKKETYKIDYQKFSFDQKQELISEAMIKCIEGIKSFKQPEKIQTGFIVYLIKNSFKKTIESRKINYIF
jgi:hypothetical protein